MKTFADKILAFQATLSLDVPLPRGVTVMNPYKEKEAALLCDQFYHKYYSDGNTRTMILGINPGRFGGGITGIPFTDPVKLESYCGISNNLQKKTELSADFIYTMIQAYGGSEKFYSHFYISAISPLGFMRDGKNLNYYDVRELQERIQDFIIQSLKKQLEFGIDRKVCYCLGEGQNFKFLSILNKTYSFFDRLVPLSHPRFIMQYRRKQVPTFVNDYLKKFALEN